MSNVYYTSLSGMMAANYGLQNTSNNIANMQSHGFKRTDVFYSALGHGGQEGVMVGGQNIDFSAGHYLETGNASDLAIVGDGFFIIKLQHGELRYTRDGEFAFDKDGLLTDKQSHGLVQGYDAKGVLVNIHQAGPKTNTGKATHFIDLKGEWVIIPLEDALNTPTNPDPLKSKYEPIRFNVANVFDQSGKAHTLRFEFEAPGMPGAGKNPFDNLKWDLINVSCDDALVTFDPQSIEFDSDNDGAAKQNNQSIHLQLDGNQKITFNFGDYMSDKASSVRLYQKNSAEHSTTNTEVKQQDGYGIGKQIGFSFDNNGLITYQYDNGQSTEGIHVALALFEDLDHTLSPMSDHLFRADPHQNIKIGRPNQLGFGTIEPKQLEASNVDSTMEFGNIVVLQRMFQACSQIMDIDKQLLEELYES